MQRIKIWDLPVRLFHWALVIAFGFSVFSAFQDKVMTGYDVMHLRAGVCVLILVLFRDLWGFLGSTTARFMSFVKGPAALRQHITEMRADKPYEYVGHNPLGGWSVGIMLDSLMFQAILGLFSSDDMFFEGPLAKTIEGSTVGVVSLIHQLVGYFIITVVGLHILAVIYYGIGKGINLIRPMITGSKMVSDEVALANKGNIFVSPWTALLLFVLSGLVVCTAIF